MNNPLGFLLRITCLLIIQVLKIIVNILFFLLPVGIYVLIMQFTRKMSAMSSIETYVDPSKGEWMFIYPNTILVTTDANLYKKNINKVVKSLNKFLETNKNILALLFAISVLLILILLVIRSI